MFRLLWILLSFTVLASAVTINNVDMHEDVHSYIAAPNELLYIEAKECKDLPHTGKHYTVKTLNNTTLHCDNRDIQVIIKDAKSHKGKINHYKIGAYPKPMRGLKSYKAPQYFLTLKNAKDNIKLSSHFYARDFLCKQVSKYPKYLVVQSSLINLLEKMIDEAGKRGVTIKKFVIMSGYRTPAYNKAIGSSTYSRHMYGDASDIYVDDNHDGFFDDLDGDGKITNKDTKWLANLANDVQRKYNIKGGVGIYKRNSRHPRFVHVDARGYYARWGH